MPYGFNSDKSKYDLEEKAEWLKVITRQGVATAGEVLEFSITDEDFDGDDCRNYIPIATSLNWHYDQYNTQFSPYVINIGGTVYSDYLYPQLRLYDNIGHQWYFRTYVQSVDTVGYNISIYFLKIS